MSDVVSGERQNLNLQQKNEPDILSSLKVYAPKVLPTAPEIKSLLAYPYVHFAFLCPLFSNTIADIAPQHVQGSRVQVLCTAVACRVGFTVA